MARIISSVISIEQSLLAFGYPGPLWMDIKEINKRPPLNKNIKMKPDPETIPYAISKSRVGNNKRLANVGSFFSFSGHTFI